MQWQQHGLTAGLTAIALAVCARMALRQPPITEGAVTIEYPLPLRLFFWGGIVFLTAIAIDEAWPLFNGTATTMTIRRVAVSAPTVTLFTWAILSETRVRLHLDLEGIRGQTAFRGKRSIAWADVTEVKWKNGFTIVDRHGEKIRISRFLRGHQNVPAMLRAKVAAPVWENAIAAWEKDGEL